MRPRRNGAGRGRKRVDPVKVAPAPEKPVEIGSNSGVKRRRIEYDPELDTILDLIKHMKPQEVSLASGNLVAASTIYSWRRGKVRTPLNYTVRAAYKACGYELVLKKMK